MLAITRPGLTIEQHDIINHVLDFENNNKHVIVNAYAGSGKTTTILEILGAVEKAHPHAKSMYLVFNRKNADEAQEKMARNGLRNSRASTLHSLGYSIVSEHIYPVKLKKANSSKYYNIATKLADKAADDGYITREDKWTVSTCITELCKYVRLWCLGITEDNIEMLADMYDIDTTLENGRDIHQLGSLVRNCLMMGDNQAIDSGIIDFIDMTWLPVRFDMQCKQYDYVMIDEAQDTSVVLQKLAMKLMRKNSMFISVGDKYQAIYGFAGAAHTAFENISKELDGNTVEFPLSVCWRCSQEVVLKAKEYVPGINTHAGAPLGQVQSILGDKMAELAGPKDFILCRTNALTVNAAYTLINKNKPIVIKGKEELLQSLSKFFTEVSAMDGFDFDHFPHYARIYLNNEIAIAMKKKRFENKVSALNDRFETLMAVYNNSNSKTEEEFYASLKYLFDDRDNATIIMTGHKAKGDETNNVFVYRSMVPRQVAQEWQNQQEKNLVYVMVTRAQQNLYLVD